MPPKASSASDGGMDETSRFLWTCLRNIKGANGKPLQPNWKLVGQELNMKPHTAYNRYYAYSKKMANEPDSGAATNDLTDEEESQSQKGKRKRRASTAATTTRRRSTATETKPKAKKPRGRPKRRVVTPSPPAAMSDGDEAEDEKEEPDAGKEIAEDWTKELLGGEYPLFGGGYEHSLGDDEASDEDGYDYKKNRLVLDSI